MTDQDDQHKDLTRIEDLSEFLHEIDPATDALLEFGTKGGIPAPASLDDLPEEVPEEPIEAPEIEAVAEDNLEQDLVEAPLEEAPELSPEIQNDPFSDSSDNSASQDTSSDFLPQDDLSLSDSEMEEASFELADDENEETLDNNFSLSDEAAEDSDNNDFLGQGDDDSEDPNKNGDFETTRDINTEDDQLAEVQSPSEWTSELNFSSEDEGILAEQQFDELPENNLDVTDSGEFADKLEVSFDDEPVSREETSSDHSPIIEELPEIDRTEQAYGQVKTEDFSDVRKFGEHITYGQVSVGGNPPFSIILRKIKYQEDADRIKEILSEHGLINDSNTPEIEQGIQNGSLLISQISEFSAIYLAHRFRQFDLTLEVGLSSELHKSKNYSHDDYVGLVSKSNIGQNKEENVVLRSGGFSPQDIMIATTPSLESYRIVKYIDIVSDHALIDEEVLEDIESRSFAEDNNNQSCDKNHENDQWERAHEFDPPGAFDDNTNPKMHSLKEDYALGLNEFYYELAQNLKVKAHKKGGNAVIGINFQISPLVSHSEGESTNRYKLTCTGSVVLVSRKEGVTN